MTKNQTRLDKLIEFAESAKRDNYEFIVWDNPADYDLVIEALRRLRAAHEPSGEPRGEWTISGEMPPPAFVESKPAAKSAGAELASRPEPSPPAGIRWITRGKPDFAHWREDSNVPYDWCDCVSCSKARTASMNTVPTFDSLGWSTLPGRGDVAVVILDRDCQRHEFPTIFARVLIDGKEYEPIGFETFAIEPQRKGSKIGILVSKR